MDLSGTSIAELAALLRRPVTDEKVISFFGPLLLKIRRRAYRGYIALKNQGWEAAFSAAPWVIPPSEIVNPNLLYLSAFHFHRKGHQGHSGYPGKLPNGIAWGDSKQELLKNLGEPFAAGGGGMSSLPPKMPIPHWLKYRMDEAFLHFQLDDADRIEMLTLMAPQVWPDPAK